MKKLIIALTLSLLMVATVVAPAAAATEQAVPGSVTVNEVLSITLTDPGDSGLNFGSVTPPITGVGDIAQSDGTPAIAVTVGSETNVLVDIGVKGFLVDDLTLPNWQYSTTFGGAKTALTASFAEVYADAAASSVSDFYHWVDVPTGTPGGAQTITVTYKAVKADTSF